MNITIDLPILIAKAKQHSGMKLGDMAKEMHVSPARISDWTVGRGNPLTDQIAYLADKADLPILETIAALRPEWAHVWQKAAKHMRNL